MDGESEIVPRPPGTYWAAVAPDDLGPQVRARYLEYLRELQLRGFLGLWSRLASTYYGYDPATGALSDWISEDGEQGEFLSLHVNEFGSLIKHQLILTTSEQIEIDCIPTNDAPESEAQATLGEQVIRYYFGEGGVERGLVQCAHRKLLFGKAYVVQLWDAFRGPESGVEEVPARDDSGQPLTERVEVEVPAPGMPQMGMQEAPPEMRRETVERPVMTERIRRAGDIVHRVYSPIDVAHDVGARTGEALSWYVVRERIDRWELAARYPEHRQYIIERPAFNRDETAKWERGSFSLSEQLTTRTDQIHVLRLVHDRCEALPQGLEALVCGDVVLGPAMPLVYKRLPVHPMVAQEILDTPIGYSESANMLGPQAALNAAASNGLTSSDAGSVPKWAVPRGANVGVESLAPNMRVVYYDPQPQAPNGGMPELLRTPEWRDVHATQIQVWRETLQIMSGVNAVVRGQSEGKSGADNALIQAQAIQYMNGDVRAYSDTVRSVALGIVEVLQAFAEEERLLRIVGEDESPTVTYFKGSDLRDIRHVEVDLGDPVMRTMQGRRAIASELLERFPQQITPEQYLAFIGTGRLEPLWKAQRNQVRLIRAENASLAKGQPVQALISDCHMEHIREHLAQLSSPALRAQPALVEATLAHVMEHETLWGMLGMRPALLAATAQPPPPPPPGMGMPMGGPDGPPPQDGPPPDGPAGEPASVPGGPEAVAGVEMPRMPRNAATGEPAMQPEGPGGMA